MRRAWFVVLFSIALLPASAISSTGSSSADRGQSYVRSAIPVIEAYYADEGTYVGMTLKKLHDRYDSSIRNVAIRRATKTGYCVQNTGSRPTYHFNGPAGPLRTGPCGTRGSVVPRDGGTNGSSPSSSAAANVRGAVPAIEAYWADHGTYAGMTLAKLQQIDAGIRAISIAYATATRYCIQSTVGSVTYHYAGPAGPAAPGPCS